MIRSDLHILRAIQQGDHQAFQELFNSHFDGLLGYGIQLTADREISRELVQDIFINLWNNRHKLKVKTTLKTYLFSSMHHRALNWIRHGKIETLYRQQRLGDLLSGYIPPPEVSPFLADYINQAIERLPVRSRMVFNYTQIEELSYKETASRMGISIRTVENLLARARKLLRHALKNL